MLVKVDGELPVTLPSVCPPETRLDGLACTHTRVTCGRWDGLSCDPSSAASPEQERAARDEFARIDDEARMVCPEDDESRQVYSGHAPEILKAMNAAIGHAEKIGQRLAQLRGAHPAPRWEVASFARIGSLYDCLWNGMRQSTAVFVTPQQQALLAKLAKVPTQVNQAGVPGRAQRIQGQIAGTQQAVADKWHSTRDEYLAVLETRMIPAYVTATLLARRYALEGFALTRASERLPIVASILGDEEMGRLMEGMADPTDPQPDPAKRRRLIYTAGAFGVAR